MRKITISNKQFVVLIILSSLALFVGDTAFGMAFQQVFQSFIGANPAAGVEAVAFNALIAGIFFTIFFNWFFLTGNEKPLDGLKLGVLYGVLISVPMASGFYYFTVANTQYIGTIFLNMQCLLEIWMPENKIAKTRRVFESDKFVISENKFDDSIMLVKWANSFILTS